MIEFCGESITESRAAAFVSGGVLAVLLGLGAWSADWAQRHFERIKQRPRILRRSRLPAEPIEEIEDD